MEETPKKKKKKPSYRVVAIEFNNTAEGGKDTKTGVLARVAQELEKTMRNFKHWGYNFRIEEYPQGMLVIGEREHQLQLPEGLLPLLASMRRPPQDPMTAELMQVNPAHIDTLNQVLIGMERLPQGDATALPRLVADVTRGMPGDRLREIIAAGEKVAEAHEKHRPDPSCTLVVRVRQVVDVMKKQVQLQTS